MHIPKGESTTMEVLTFEKALETSGTGCSYDTDTWIYVPDYYTEYRYILGTKGTSPLICIGINPSTAAPNDLDNTLKSVSRIACANGYDSWIMFNVYAQRSTDPDMMDVSFNPELHRENMKAFEYILADAGKNARPAVWAAWGTIIEKRPYLRKCVEDMAELAAKYSADWLCAGKTSKKGHPHHPLYLKKDEKTLPFDIDRYLRECL